MATGAATRSRRTRASKAEQLGEVERVYRIVKEWLITAKLPPGAFLSEPDLAFRCQTSRTPVREACTRLMQDNWLSRIPRKGFLVTPISVRDIVELYEYRKLLECFAAERVAHMATPEHIEELNNLLGPERSPAGLLERILEANEKFHLRLSEIAGNQQVLGRLRLTLGYVRRLDTLCTQTVPGWIGHSEIIGALKRRDPVQARQAMAVHIDLSREKIVKLFSS